MNVEMNLLLNNEIELIIVLNVKPLTGAPIWAVVALNNHKDCILLCLLDSDWSVVFD